ncbi:hypothetical protein ACFPES_02965 [Paenibacillus sp. GCM10023248]|uniref:hypothetical protein n=1 Tax=unclassified Paenibacillus TaxID=185978 RepID=UPI002378FCDC|nr:hypothetical protein [Paenibacillus sp. MAHUQ-63]MDD9265986.1 hypothetical protein [Paenibacillus sp. MAHUQ-63]
MIQLLAAEAIVFEGLKAGKKVSQIAKELDDPKSVRTYARINKMMELGVITREGYPKKYVYHCSDKPYEVVESREAKAPTLSPAEPDTVLCGLIEFSLSEDKLQFLKKNYQIMSRTQLAKKLCVNKLELTYVMHKLGLKQKEVKGEAAVVNR